MYTSAHALNEVLTLLSQNKQGKERVPNVLVRIFGLEGFDAEGEATLRLRKLILKVRHDIEILETNTDNKKQLDNNISAFNGVVSFSQLNFTIDEARKHWLKSDNLVGLNYIGMELYGKVNHRDADEECHEAIQIIDELQNQISDANLTKEIKDAIDRRLIQIKNVLDRFRRFGPEGLEEYLLALVGQICIFSAELRKSDDGSMMRSVGKLTRVGLDIIQKTSTATHYMRIGLEEGKNILRLLEFNGGE